MPKTFGRKVQNGSFIPLLCFCALVTGVASNNKISFMKPNYVLIDIENNDSLKGS